MDVRRTILAIPADTHNGSTVGLLPPGWKKADGETIQRSVIQKVIWEQWERCWDRVRVLRKGARLIVVVDGDAIDGNHHHSTQLITSDPNEQSQMHIASMDYGLKIAKYNPKKGDKGFYVAGTEVHVGTYEDKIARDLPGFVPAIEPSDLNGGHDGRFTHYHLKLNINGVLFDITHQGFTPGTMAHTKGNSIRSKMRSYRYQCLSRGKPVPRYMIRSHYHQWLPEIVRDGDDTIEGFITPPFQMKTRYGHKVANMELTEIGMLIFEIETNGESRWECPRTEYDQVKEVRV